MFRDCRLNDWFGPYWLRRDPVCAMHKESSAILLSMGIDEEIIHEIVKRVTSVVKAERIILFGSAATGHMTRDSDIDLLVIENSIENRDEDWLRLQQALRGMGYPFDIIVMARDRFEETKDVIGGIAYPAHRQGKVVYEAA